MLCFGTALTYSKTEKNQNGFILKTKKNNCNKKELQPYLKTNLKHLKNKNHETSIKQFVGKSDKNRIENFDHRSKRNGMCTFQKRKKENFQRRPALGYSTPQKESWFAKTLLLKGPKSKNK